jgi:glycogen debranching enzyme
MIIESATEILERSIIFYRGAPVGTAAACVPSPEAENYTEVFVRDFVPSAIYFLMIGRPEIVRNFLSAVMELRGQQPVAKGQKRSEGLMPASFHVQQNNGEEQLVADFGERAIGRVVPVDSAMWWMFTLRAYVIATSDWEFINSTTVQSCIRDILDLYLRDQFASTPTLLVPDGAFMIDRRMAVYGYPLEIQALYFGMLLTALELLQCTGSEKAVLHNLELRIEVLRSYVRKHYWVDRKRLNEIHRFKGEEFGIEVSNVLNVYPESIPDWMDGWLDGRSGYLVGNQGPGRVDFRFFAQGNLLAILFRLATESESLGIMNLFELHWDKLMGEMPVKIAYPAVGGKEWMHLTGSDPKNTPWCYHNGGNWPVLIWPFVGAALRMGREDLAEKAIQLLSKRIEVDNWPEYYDGRTGSLIGRRANFFQVWSATGLLVAHEIMENMTSLAMFNLFAFTDVAVSGEKRSREPPEC